jgi:hypothetical protein
MRNDMVKGHWLILYIIFYFLVALALPCAAQQQASLSYIGNATVTLYYYDEANGTKGGIVPMPDNPQYVNFDPAIAAPGMYTFSHVPAGQWYYLEAEHEGKKWYTIFYMQEGMGTKTANVHIPPFTPINATAAPEAIASPTPAPCPTPAPSPATSPGPGVLAALLGITITILMRRR